jgi:hypothetical protein
MHSETGLDGAGTLRHQSAISWRLETRLDGAGMPPHQSRCLVEVRWRLVLPNRYLVAGRLRHLVANDLQARHSDLRNMSQHPCTVVCM